MRYRNNSVSIWLNDKEYAHLQRQAQIAGCKAGVLIRELINGGNIKERPPEMWAELLRHLAAIGNNINQIARIANSSLEISKEDILAVKQMQSEIWQRVKNI